MLWPRIICPSNHKLLKLRQTSQVSINITAEVLKLISCKTNGEIKKLYYLFTHIIDF